MLGEVATFQGDALDAAVERIAALEKRCGELRAIVEEAAGGTGERTLERLRHRLHVLDNGGSAATKNRPFRDGREETT